MNYIPFQNKTNLIYSQLNINLKNYIYSFNNNHNNNKKNNITTTYTALTPLVV